jgi:hypothetical protein
MIIFCIVVWFYCIPYRIVGDAPKFFPRLIIFFILIPSILLIVNRRQAPKDKPIRFRTRKDLHKAMITAVFFIVYIALIDVLGYFTASFLAIMLFLYFFGQRSWTGLILVPAGVLFFIYFVIERTLSFPLPKGFMY